MNREDTLSKTGKDLMLKEPYYGFFLIKLNKIWNNRVPTAGVCKNGINYQLAINEKFWTDLSEDHRLGLLKHELLHIAFGHLTTVFKFSDRRLANIAMDMEINQYISDDLLPVGGIDINNYPVAKKYFEIEKFKALNIVNDDAFEYVKTTHKKFDLIISDLFIDGNVPEQFASSEYITNLKRISNSSSCLIYNKMTENRKHKKEVKAFEKLFSEVFTGAQTHKLIANDSENSLLYYNTLLLK